MDPAMTQERNMKTTLLVAFYLVILAHGCAHTPPHSETPEWQIEGHQFSHPLKPNVRYYFASRDDVTHLPRGHKKHVGFWASEDGGRNWRKRSRTPP